MHPRYILAMDRGPAAQVLRMMGRSGNREQCVWLCTESGFPAADPDSMRTGQNSKKRTANGRPPMYPFARQSATRTRYLTTSSFPR